MDAKAGGSGWQGGASKGLESVQGPDRGGRRAREGRRITQRSLTEKDGAWDALGLVLCHRILVHDW